MANVFKNFNLGHALQALLMFTVGLAKAYPANPLLQSVEQMAIGALGVLAFVTGSVVAPAPAPAPEVK